MKVKQLIKKLQKFDPESEVMISETACNNVHHIDDVFAGWFVDDEFNPPEVISEGENPEDYDIDITKPKVVCIE
jgi:hypothetical protein